MVLADSPLAALELAHLDDINDREVSFNDANVCSNQFQSQTNGDCIPLPHLPLLGCFPSQLKQK